jgi:beta-xylosidase
LAVVGLLSAVAIVTLTAADPRALLIAGAHDAPPADDTTAVTRMTSPSLPAQPPGPPTGLALDRDFPDPAILPDGGQYVAFSTQSAGLHVPVTTSADLTTWSEPVEALPRLPGWSGRRRVWAPAAIRRDDGRYLLAYSTFHRRSDDMCVSIAVAHRTTGPYVDESRRPLVCDHDLGGSIDPSFFVDHDGTTWLLWKAEGDDGTPAQIFSQQLDSATLTLVGQPRTLLVRDLGWEDPTIENPALAVVDGTYVLLYSANRWETGGYTTGWATCSGPAGPCAKAKAPLLTNDADRSGPGGASWFVSADGRPWVAYHGWADGMVGYPSGRRALYLADSHNLLSVGSGGSQAVG